MLKKDLSYSLRTSSDNNGGNDVPVADDNPWVPESRPSTDQFTLKRDNVLREILAREDDKSSAEDNEVDKEVEVFIGKNHGRHDWGE